MPRDMRTTYYAGLGSTLRARQHGGGGRRVPSVLDSLPPLVSAALFLLTPMYFLTSLWGSARERAGHVAMVLGLVLGPVVPCRRAGLRPSGRRAFGGGSAPMPVHRLSRSRRVHDVRVASTPGGGLLCSSSSPAGSRPTAGASSASISAAASREDSDILVLVRAIATALVAAVIGNLICFPSGALAAAPVALRLGAAALALPPTCCSAGACCRHHRGRDRSVVGLWRDRLGRLLPNARSWARAARIFSAFAASTSGFSICPCAASAPRPRIAG